MKIERKNIAILEKRISKESLDGQRWGFLIEPKQVGNLIELRIIFDLLIPINSNEYAFVKSGSLYFIHEIAMNNLVRNMDFLETIIQQSMMHTRNMFRQVYPQHSGVEIELFNKAHFSEETMRQLTENGLIKSPLKRIALQYKVKIDDLPLIGVRIMTPKNETETIALIKESDHRNYINSKLVDNIAFEEIKNNLLKADIRINHDKSPLLKLEFEINDRETNDLYQIVIGTHSLASLGIGTDFYLREKEMAITIPIAEPISEN